MFLLVLAGIVFLLILASMNTYPVEPLSGHSVLIRIFLVPTTDTYRFAAPVKVLTWLNKIRCV